MDLTGCLFKFKVVLLGYNNVGKSCIIKRYTEATFPQHMLTTIGVNFSTHCLEVEPGVKVQLQILDTAGVENYWSTTRYFLPKTNGFLLVFDVGNEHTFRHAEYLHKEVCKIMQLNTVPFVLVGNKCDQNERTVDRGRAEMVASQWKAPYIEVSAKTGHNVVQSFELLTHQICQGLLMEYESSEECDGDMHEYNGPE